MQQGPWHRVSHTSRARRPCHALARALRRSLIYCPALCLAEGPLLLPGTAVSRRQQLCSSLSAHPRAPHSRQGCPGRCCPQGRPAEFLLPVRRAALREPFQLRATGGSQSKANEASRELPHAAFRAFTPVIPRPFGARGLFQRDS